jgi:hypothetical protein
MSKHTNHSNLENRLQAAGERFKISPSLKTELKGEVMSKIAGLTVKPAQPWYRPALSWAPAAMAGIVILTSGTAVLADTAKPGDFFYPVDTFTESISEKLVRDESAKAKFYASLAEERVAELNKIESAKPENSSESRQTKWEKSRQEAVERSAVSLERLNQIQELVLDKYEQTDKQPQKDAFLKLSKVLQQVIDRQGQVAGKVEDKLNAKEDSAKEAQTRFRLRPEAKSKIRQQVRRQFGWENGNNPTFNNPTSSSPGSGNGSGGGSNNDNNGIPPVEDWSDLGNKDETPIPDPNFPGIFYGNNSLIESGVNQIIAPQPKLPVVMP